MTSTATSQEAYSFCVTFLEYAPGEYTLSLTCCEEPQDTHVEKSYGERDMTDHPSSTSAI